eukprot:symbB.v1.2.035417.t1/scaffold4734.1/size35659/1
MTTYQCSSLSSSGIQVDADGVVDMVFDAWVSEPFDECGEGSCPSCTAYKSCVGPMVQTDQQMLNAGDCILWEYKTEGGSDAFEVFVGVFGSSGNLVTNDWKRGESASSQLDWTFGQLEVNVSGSYYLSFFLASYDATGGGALGAAMGVRNIRSISPCLDDETLQNGPVPTTTNTNHFNIRDYNIEHVNIQYTHIQRYNIEHLVQYTHIQHCNSEHVNVQYTHIQRYNIEHLVQYTHIQHYNIEHVNVQYTHIQRYNFEHLVQYTHIRKLQQRARQHPVHSHSALQHRAPCPVHSHPALQQRARQRPAHSHSALQHRAPCPVHSHPALQQRARQRPAHSHPALDLWTLPGVLKLQRMQINNLLTSLCQVLGLSFPLPPLNDRSPSPRFGEGISVEIQPTAEAEEAERHLGSPTFTGLLGTHTMSRTTLASSSDERYAKNEAWDARLKALLASTAPGKRSGKNDSSNADSKGIRAAGDADWGNRARSFVTVPVRPELPAEDLED